MPTQFPHQNTSNEKPVSSHCCLIVSRNQEKSGGEILNVNNSIVHCYTNMFQDNVAQLFLNWVRMVNVQHELCPMFAAFCRQRGSRPKLRRATQQFCNSIWFRNRCSNTCFIASPPKQWIVANDFWDRSQHVWIDVFFVWVHGWNAIQHYFHDVCFLCVLVLRHIQWHRQFQNCQRHVFHQMFVLNLFVLDCDYSVFETFGITRTISHYCCNHMIVMPDHV